MRCGATGSAIVHATQVEEEEKEAQQAQTAPLHTPTSKLWRPCGGNNNNNNNNNNNKNTRNNKNGNGRADHPYPARVHA